MDPGLAGVQIPKNKETKMTAEKTVNYTEAQETALTEAYTAGREAGQSNAEILAELMENTKRTKRSLISKLVHMGVYVKEEKVKVAKVEDEGPTKKELVRELQEVLNGELDAETVAGIMPAKKETIAAFLELFKAEEEDEGAEEENAAEG